MAGSHCVSQQWLSYHGFWPDGRMPMRVCAPAPATQQITLDFYTLAAVPAHAVVLPGKGGYDG